MKFNWSFFFVIVVFIVLFVLFYAVVGWGYVRFVKR